MSMDEANEEHYEELKSKVGKDFDNFRSLHKEQLEHLFQKPVEEVKDSELLLVGATSTNLCKKHVEELNEE